MPDDLLKIKGVLDPQISSDGQRVAFVVSVADIASNRNLTDIWVSEISETTPSRITKDGKSITPRWSPDGRTIAHISKQGEKRSCA